MSFPIEVGSGVAEVRPDTNLGDLCHEHRLPVQLSCRGGACGTCLARVLTGQENLSARSENEEALIPELVIDDGSYRLVCQTTVHGPVKIQWVDLSSPVRIG